MKTFIDQTGREIQIADKLNSIVSLVPSLTELLFFFKMDDKITGITDFCVHPADKTEKIIKVGGPLNFSIEKIKALKPDLIVASKSENNKQKILELAKNFPVFISDVKNLEDAYKLIEKLGNICNQTELAQNLTQNLASGFDRLSTPLAVSAVYLVWEKPYIVAGNETFIHDILKNIGIDNSFVHLKGYQKIIGKQLSEIKADILLLPSEPYAFDKSHIEHYKKLLPDSKILLVDGQLFCWYGNRLLLAINYLKNLKSLIKSICRK